MATITVVGGGLAGLIAAVTCAEHGARVVLHEKSRRFGGRSRATTGRYVAHQGPHVLYSGGSLWDWLQRRRLLADVKGVPLSGLTRFRFRFDGELRRIPPPGVLGALLRARRPAPEGIDFRSWIRAHHADDVAAALSNMAGVATFYHDPGQLSASYVAERLVRVFLSFPPAAHYLVGGWNPIIAKIVDYAAVLGVEMRTDSRVDRLPEAPVIVATSMPAARNLLGEDGLEWPSGDVILADIGLRDGPDPFVVSDLDEAGWLERFSLADSSVAPPGHELVQAQLPIRPDENRRSAEARMERFLDLALDRWRSRTVWRRISRARRRSGALDFPGTSWRDRPAIDRGGGVFLVGDMVAAPGLLSEVSAASALVAAERAVGLALGDRPPAPQAAQRVALAQAVKLTKSRHVDAA